MADVFTKAKRSEVMSRIRGKGNRNTELRLLSILREKGITGWRRHLPIVGRPDFAFPKTKVAVFVDGCFWHCCPRCINIPLSNTDFWLTKLEANVRRDRRVNRELRRKGWRVVRVWEHELKQPLRVLVRIEPLVRKKP